MILVVKTEDIERDDEEEYPGYRHQGGSAIDWKRPGMEPGENHL